MIIVGIIFGGKSREREISFAGGRTVYDSLDKAIFEPVPIFMDGLGNFIELDWQYIYKGTIRDFFPPARFVPEKESAFQVYSESLGDSANDSELLHSIGTPREIADLKGKIDIAFLALHGPYGEDGFLQGLLDFYDIPYTGSGVLPSAIGISKAVQKKLMQAANFKVNRFASFNRNEFLQNAQSCYQKIESLKFPVVVKASSQGSSIGVHFLEENTFESFSKCVEKCLFNQKLHAEDWNDLNLQKKEDKLRQLFDLQHGLGLPVLIDDELIYQHNEALAILDDRLNSQNTVELQSIHGETEIVVEEKLSGKEFSCIVVRDKNGKSIALPPTEIRKQFDFFDYRSKYLPGITRKVTPIEIDEESLQNIRKACVELFEFFEFDVYARIDGFINAEGEVFLNDPNTTSGMLPSSFFFHQAAEIGLSPSQFITYIIHQSLVERRNRAYYPKPTEKLIQKLEVALNQAEAQAEEKPKVAVIFGGYSTERHISVESGRNVFEKLSSSSKVETMPVFLSKNEKDEIILHQVPINLLLKDNADDIRDKITHFKIDSAIKAIIEEASIITEQFSAKDYDFYPKQLQVERLNEHTDFAFMALHGRPGEDGTLQAIFDRIGLPYNGSGSSSSSTTIDKYATNEILQKNGVLVAKHCMVFKDEWENDKQKILTNIDQNFGYPIIVKPADDGCSSAVKKVNSAEELAHFAEAIFRQADMLTPAMCDNLGLKQNEEFPIKKGFLVEELILPKGAEHFLEITGGMLIKTVAEGENEIQAFEASEAVAEAGILSLEEKFLAGEGQNLTPARYSRNAEENAKISAQVKQQLTKTARLLKVEGYCRIDAFVRIFSPENVEVIVIEINSLPGLTPATAIFHQAAIDGLKPAEFLLKLIEYGKQRKELISE